MIFEIILGLPNNEGALSSRADSSGSPAFSPSYNFVTSDLRTGISDGSSKSAEKSVVSDGANLESSLHLGSLVQSSSGSLTDWIQLQGHDHFFLDKDVVSHNASSSSLQHCKEMQYGMPNYIEPFRFAAEYLNSHDPNSREASDFHHLDNETEFQFTCLEGVYHSEST